LAKKLKNLRRLLLRLGALRVELYSLLEPLFGVGRIDDLAVHEMHEQILRKLKCRESNSFDLFIPRHLNYSIALLLPDAAAGITARPATTSRADRWCWILVARSTTRWLRLNG